MIGYNDSKGRINYICFMPTALMIGLFFANISSGFEAIGVSQQIVSALSKLFIAFAFLLCIPLLRGRKANIIIAIFMASSITICLNYLYYSFTNNNNAYLTNTTMTYVTQCLPALLIVSNIYRNEHEIMLIYLKKSSMIISCISFLLMIMNIMGSNLFRIKGYSMGLGYALILPCIILLYDYSEKDSYLSFFLSLSDLLFIVLFGSRGAVLGIVFYYIYFVLIKNLVQQKHTVRTIAVTIFSLVIVLSIKEILQVVYEWLTKKGYYSRTIYLLLFDIYHDSHRNEIYARLISAIEEHPFTFRGISSDYLLVDTYSHNIFIEIIYEFGLLLAIPKIIQPYAEYAHAKILLDDNEIHDTEKAVQLLKENSAGNNWCSCLLGKLYLFGNEDVEKNKAEAVKWLNMSAEAGNEYAQHLLENADNNNSEMITSTITSMMINLGHIIEEDNRRSRKKISRADRKLLRIIQKKKQELGIKSDSVEPEYKC